MLYCLQHVVSDERVLALVQNAIREEEETENTTKPDAVAVDLNFVSFSN